jgi:hypothetical protein
MPRGVQVGDKAPDFTLTSQSANRSGCTTGWATG